MTRKQPKKPAGIPDVLGDLLGIPLIKGYKPRTAQGRKFARDLEHRPKHVNVRKPAPSKTERGDEMLESLAERIDQTITGLDHLG